MVAVVLCLALLPVAAGLAQDLPPTTPGTDSAFRVALSDAAGPLATVTLSPAAADPIVVPILFPIEDPSKVTYWVDTFGAPRSGNRSHEGNDLMAPKMTRLIAVVDGKLDWMSLNGECSSYNGLPYYNILLRGDDGNVYYYIHLNNDTPGTDDAMGGVENAYAPGLTNGSRVKAGDFIGYVGDSGNAEDAGSHLHFEIHVGGYKKNLINPYHSLKAAPSLAEWDAAGRPPLSSYAPGQPAPTTPTTPPAKPVVPGFKDVEDWFRPELAKAAAAGVVEPDADGRFRPYSKVDRALFTVYLVRAMEASGKAGASSGDTGTKLGQRFTDVGAKHWACAEIEKAARLGLVRGTGDGSTFAPEQLINRAQMATMICRALGDDPELSKKAADLAAYKLYNDVGKGFWAQGAIVKANKLGLLCGDGDHCFRPDEDANRAHAIKVMARLMDGIEGGSIR
jgi:hypothetical protein